MEIKKYMYKLSRLQSQGNKAFSVVVLRSLFQDTLPNH